MNWEAARKKRWRVLSRDEVVALIKSRCVISESGCWVWQKSCNTWGYGQVQVNKKRWMVHRLMYTLHKGEIADGLDCLHDCDNPPCCNPDHLWLGTQLQNSLDMASKGRTDAQKRTHCTRGHDYAVHGVRHGKNQWRQCTICTRGRLRLRAGWPQDLAFSIDPIPNGFRPFSGKWKR